MLPIKREIIDWMSEHKPAAEENTVHNPELVEAVEHELENLDEE